MVLMEMNTNDSRRRDDHLAGARWLDCISLEMLSQSELSESKPLLVVVLLVVPLRFVMLSDDCTLSAASILPP